MQSWFTSRREWWLWVATLSVVAAIYSTLGLASTLAAELRSRDLADLGFAVGVGTIAAGVVLYAVRTRPLVGDIGAGIGVAAVYLMAFSRMATPEERTHLIEYGVVAVLVLEALTERSDNGRPVPMPAVVAVAVTAAVGAVDEAIQAVLPSRVFDPIDLVFNGVAALLAVAATRVLRRWRDARGS